MVKQVILGNHLFIILCLPDFIQHSIYLICITSSHFPASPKIHDRLNANQPPLTTSAALTSPVSSEQCGLIFLNNNNNNNTKSFRSLVIKPSKRS